MSSEGYIPSQDGQDKLPNMSLVDVSHLPDGAGPVQFQAWQSAHFHPGDADYEWNGERGSDGSLIVTNVHTGEKSAVGGLLYVDDGKLQEMRNLRTQEEIYSFRGTQPGESGFSGFLKRVARNLSPRG